MAFFKKLEEVSGIKLPAKYSKLTRGDRYVVRELYFQEQKGLCYHCKSSIVESPPDWIKEKRIDWDLFPPNFQDFPIHLHHSHDTDMTIGVVHARCNAVLWQYHGE